MKPVGVLALQGDFQNHIEKLEALGAECLEIRQAEELSRVRSLVIPGGESSAMLKLLSPEFRQALVSVIQSGLPVLATCAGLILLAKKVSNPSQESLGVLGVHVERNGYGRQIDSAVVDELDITKEGKEHGLSTLEGVFIRAPRILSVEPGVQVLAQRDNEPVLVRQGNIWAMSFHPEVGEGESELHWAFAGMGG